LTGNIYLSHNLEMSRENTWWMFFCPRWVLWRRNLGNAPGFFKIHQYSSSFFVSNWVIKRDIS
jgi:hypothetical protein